MNNIESRINAIYLESQSQDLQFYNSDQVSRKMYATV